MPISRNMSRLINYAVHNLDNVSVGVTAGLKEPNRGVGIEFTIQQKGQRWGFRMRQQTSTKRYLFHATEQRSGLFHYGLRGPFGHNGSGAQKVFPHPYKLWEIVEQWPQGFWPKGLNVLTQIAKVSAK
jgi:hypothetical protein